MLKATTILILLLYACLAAHAQDSTVITRFTMHDDVFITIDQPANMNPRNETIIILYALPNGNTTAQTMGKQMQPGDDWHYNIQHIAAQTKFVRHALPAQNIITIYLENKYKSWPAWRQKSSDAATFIPHIIDSLYSMIPAKRKVLYLNGHSGGGSFIFGYLKTQTSIPAFIKRISFLDSEYGYDSSLATLFKQWLLHNTKAYLSVFAYNDSIALYNGKPVVSATGGTWYRSKLMLKDLSENIPFQETQTDSVTAYISKDKRVQFFFKQNLDRGIYHTQQVERNGFIHSVLCGTSQDSKGYKYYDTAAYRKWIK
ncbi:MAG: hypothetical protein J0I41_05780 [Filimonas sp.]|nr:hypothetical protein [Filimonas sp.]